MDPAFEIVQYQEAALKDLRNKLAASEARVKKLEEALHDLVNLIDSLCVGEQMNGRWLMFDSGAVKQARQALAAEVKE